jgi:O-antigen/teichoic acid export membrane protein
MLTGLAGMFNESIANLFLQYTWPEGLIEGISNRGAVGIYSNTLKISVFMTLAIQAFRYAAEPFFFSKAKEKDSPELFSRVMHYFILTALAILFAVSVNVDLIGFIFLRKPEFRVALYLVPILLFAKLLYGIYINLSIWFKLTDKTRFGLYFSLTGAGVTILGNLLLIPLIGYNASALSMVMCYLVMVSLCYIYGQKYYPIPYRFGRTIPYFILVFLLVILGRQIELSNFYLESGIKLIATLFVLGIFVVYEKKSLKSPENTS